MADKMLPDPKLTASNILGNEGAIVVSDYFIVTVYRTFAHERSLLKEACARMLG